MKFYAHTAEDEQGNRLPETHWQPLVVHLRNVAALAQQFATSLGLASEAEQAGLLHDLGKYRDEFQQSLRGERGCSVETQQAVYGAAWAFAKAQIGSSFAVAGHYAGWHDNSDVQANVTMAEETAADKDSDAKRARFFSRCRRIFGELLALRQAACRE